MVEIQISFIETNVVNVLQLNTVVGFSIKITLKIFNLLFFTMKSVLMYHHSTQIAFNIIKL